VLSVGLVVDDAIVIVENVERHLHMGKSPITAAKDARPRAGRSDYRYDDTWLRCMPVGIQVIGRGALP